MATQSTTIQNLIHPVPDHKCGCQRLPAAATSTGSQVLLPAAASGYHQVLLPAATTSTGSTQGARTRSCCCRCIFATHIPNLLQFAHILQISGQPKPADAHYQLLCNVSPNRLLMPRTQYNTVQLLAEHCHTRSPQLCSCSIVHDSCCRQQLCQQHQLLCGLESCSTAALTAATLQLLLRYFC